MFDEVDGEPGAHEILIDEQPTTSEEALTRNDKFIDVNKYKSELCRLESFIKWPRNCPVDPQDVANAGFYYVGLDDRVQCVFCQGILRNWELGDRPLVEHARHFPHCRFLNDPQAAGNVPIGDESLLPLYEMTVRGQGKFTQGPVYGLYAKIKTRIGSFENCPHITEAAYKFAAAGFYHNGTGDSVQCYYCGGGLRNWEPCDDPWIEHARWYPHCGYLRDIKGDAFITYVRTRFVVPAARLQRLQLKKRNKDTGVMEIIQSNASGDLMSTNSATPFMVTPEEVSQHMKSRIVEIAYSRYKIEDIRAVVIRRLKELGCFFPNPESLIEAVDDYIRQYPDIKAVPKDDRSPAHGLSADVERLRPNGICKICMDEEVGIVFLTCGHLVCCSKCASALKFCYMCEQVISETIKVVW